MKIITRFWLVLFVFFCTNVLQAQINQNNVAFCVETIIDDYISKIKEHSIKDSVLRIDYKKIDNKYFYQINYVSLIREVSELPSFYFKYKNFLVLVYTGIEGHLCSDRVYNTSDFTKMIEEWLYEDRIKSDNAWEKAANYVIKDNFLIYEYEIENNKIISIKNRKEDK